MNQAGKKFIRDALIIGALELLLEGRELRSKRISPYFFNSGLFNRGGRIYSLTKAYADVVFGMNIDIDVIFGPAYKGIPLAVAIAMVLWREYDIDVGYAFNRKEEKDHGEGGTIVGHSLKDKKIVIVDDVMTTGISSGNAVEIVRANGGIPVGCVIAFDRQEKGIETDLSAVQEFEKNYKIPVRAAANLDGLISVLREDGEIKILPKILAYQKQYGV